MHTWMKKHKDEHQSFNLITLGITEYVEVKGTRQDHEVHDPSSPLSPPIYFFFITVTGSTLKVISLLASIKLFSLLQIIKFSWEKRRD